MPVDLDFKSPNRQTEKPEETGSNLSPLVSPSMGDLWRFKDLTWLMVRRDLMSRYRGSLLGSFWPLISPAGHLVLYTFLFSIILKVRFGDSPSMANFALYLMTALIPWGAFAESIARSTTIILENPNLVKRVVFPLEILPLVSVLSAFLSQGLAFVILFAASTLQLGAVYPSIVFLPVISLPLLLLSCGISWFLSSLGVYVRDTRHFMSLALSAWMYSTPVVYPESALPAEFKWLALVNPMAGIVNDYRRVLLEGLPPDWSRFGVYTLLALTAWFLGYLFFIKTKKSFIDVI